MNDSLQMRPGRGSRAAAGFTVAEMIVTLAIFSIVVLGLLAMFDLNGRIARVEGRVTDMQQALRAGQQDVVRNVRMAARGGLPMALYAEGLFAGKQIPDGMAIEIDNNVAADFKVANSAEAPVLQGTDVITVRGVFTNLYQSNPAGAGLTLIDESPKDGVPEKGVLVLNNTSPTGVPQDLQSVADAIDASKKPNQTEAYLLVSPLEDAIFAVVEIDPGSEYSKLGSVVTQATVRFNASGTARSELFRQISPGGSFPRTMTTVAYSGVLEEYRYYIRDPGPLKGKIEANKGNQLEPTLVRARVYPGTDIPHKDDVTNLHEEIADDIFDLQATLGIDTNGDEIVTEGTDATTRKTDEWLFNETGDDTTTATWNGTAANPRKLSYLRITTLARTAGADPQAQWQAPVLSRVEDKDYQTAPFNEFNTIVQRRYRRQTMQSLVDLRNLS